MGGGGANQGSAVDLHFFFSVSAKSRFFSLGGPIDLLRYKDSLIPSLIPRTADIRSSIIPVGSRIKTQNL